MTEKQVISKKRVAEHGEVLTGKREVNAMLDLVKQETERIDSRFLEPACGTGNFLVAILERKLAVVEKRYGDSFEGTLLEEILGRLGVGKLVVVGAQTDFCIRSTIHGALVRGYDTTLVADAHTMEDLTQYGAPPPAQVIAHTNAYWSFQKAPGRTAGTAATKDVRFD